MKSESTIVPAVCVLDTTIYIEVLDRFMYIVHGQTSTVRESQQGERPAAYSSTRAAHSRVIRKVPAVCIKALLGSAGTRQSVVYCTPTAVDFAPSAMRGLLREAQQLA